jgi:glycosyltransferase involved in cell wall biosynthesis
MRIGFDLRPFLREETGVGIYFRNLLFHLAQIDRSNEYFLFSSSWKDRFARNEIPPFARMKFRDFRFPVKAVNFFWQRLGWPTLDFFFKTSLDVTHSPTPLLLPGGQKKIVTVCDLFFLDSPEMADDEARRAFRKRARPSLERASGIIAISEFTKEALLRKFSLPEEKIKVTYLGVNPKFLKPVSSAELQAVRTKHGLPDNFLLFVGALEPRKNLTRLLDALTIVQRKHQKIMLVVVGREGRDSANFKRKLQQLRLEEWVKIAGYLPERDVIPLYHLASAFVFPSICEGFGLPLLEAMASGLPVAAARAGALPEVGRDAALYFHPEETEDMADKIIRVLRDDTLRQELRSKGQQRLADFSWSETAAQTLQFYQSLFDER